MKMRGAKHNSSKEPREDHEPACDLQGFQALIELQKKYNRLKRHYRKDRKYYQDKLQTMADKNRSYAVKIKKLEDRLAQCD